MAVLFMEVCRLSGIPARFVSGYLESDPEPDGQELHAWAEVFIPGAGWRSYDPTLGLAVQDRHVALAASAQPFLTAPVIGAYRGTGVTGTLETEVRIETR
jgi:transglutaminase-like putative cysteine protease